MIPLPLLFSMIHFPQNKKYAKVEGHKTTDFDESKFCIRNYDLIVPNPVYALIGAYLFGRLCGFL